MQRHVCQKSFSRHDVAAGGVPTRHVRASLAAAAAALALLAPAGGSTAASIDEIQSTVREDFVNRQYYITGKLTKSIYEPDCIFKDPTTTVTGPEPYARAVATLFDPATSRADLISLDAPDAQGGVQGQGGQHLVLRWRLEGRLRLGGLALKPYTGTTRYTVDDAGLISRHDEEWDISAADAFISVLLPGFGAPPAPPVSSAPPS